MAGDAAYLAVWRADRLATRELVDGTLVNTDPRCPHETTGGYTNWACRCDRCHRAHRDAQLRLRAERAAAAAG